MFRKSLYIIVAGLLIENSEATSVCPQASETFGSIHLEACWTLDESVDTSFEDYSNNNHTAKIKGTYSIEAGAVEKAVSFSGAGFLNVPSLTNPLDTNGWSASFWLRTSSLDSQVIFQQTSRTAIQGFFLISGRLGYFQQTPTDSVSITLKAISKNIADGDWHHFVFTREANAFGWYVDGQASDTIEGSLPPFQSWDPDVGTATIGAHGEKFFPLSGSLDDVLLLSKHISTEEAAWIYNWSVNTFPEFTSTPPTQIQEDKLYSYTIAVADPDAQTLTLSLAQKPGNMILTNKLITWTPENEYVGDNTVKVKLEDGISPPVYQEFSIKVFNTNDAPEFTTDPQTNALEDAIYQYTPGINDPDLGAVTTLRVLSGPTGMQLDSGRTLRWTPTDGDLGEKTVLIEVKDDSGATDTQNFVITVNNVNDKPVILSNPSLSAVEDVLYQYQLVIHDPDPNEAHSYLIPEAPVGMTIDSAGLIQWTPTNGDIGANAVTVLVSDRAGSTVTQSFSILVENVNDIPQIISTPITNGTEDELYEYQLEVTNLDPGETLSYSLGMTPSGMTITNGGKVLWTPNDSHIGSNSVTLLVSDGSGINVKQEYTIEVANVNDKPKILSSAPTVATENLLYSYTLAVEDKDPNDALQFILHKGPTAMLLSNSGTLTWTPAPRDSGIHNISIIVKDLAAAADTQSYNLHVGSVNDPPIIHSATLPNGKEDEIYSYQLQGSDPENSPLSWLLLKGPPGLALSSKGLLTFVLQNNVNGAFEVEILATDGVQNAKRNYNLYIEPINDPPRIDSTVPTAYVYKVGEVTTFPLSASDPENNNLTWNLVSGPAGSRITSNFNFRFNPTAEQVGLDTLLFVVSDGQLSDTLVHFMLIKDASVGVKQSSHAESHFQSEKNRLTFFLSEKDSPSTIQLYNPQGKLVLQQKAATQGNYQLSIGEELHSGWYYFVATTPHRRVIQKMRF